MPGGRRWLVLLLAIAFSVSAVVHVPSGSHASGAPASHAHGLALLTQDCGGEPTCPGESGDSHTAPCSLASSCVLYVPATAVIALVLPNATPNGLEPDSDHFGTILCPHFRPPKLSASV